MGIDVVQVMKQNALLVQGEDLLVVDGEEVALCVPAKGTFVSLALTYALMAVVMYHPGTLKIGKIQTCLDSLLGKLQYLRI